MRGQRKLTSRQVRKLIGFVGYGPKRQVKILFLGYEERPPKGEKEYYKNISARMKFKPIMDLKEAHYKLYGESRKNPFNGKNPVRVWNYAARFALEFEGRRHGAKPKMQGSEYWRKHLGQKKGNTFLMECGPIPKRNYGEKVKLPPKWDWKRIWKERKDALAEALKDLRPEFVIAYGKKKGFRAKVQELFGVRESDWKSKCRTFFASTPKTHIAHTGFPGRGFACKEGIPFVVKELLKRDRRQSRRRTKS